MSSVTEEVNEEEEPRCASCGITQGDHIKLMKCTACKLARYCSIACQKEHWPKHKRQCKKRAAELRDELLFTQPESTHYGDCPICCLPLPLGLQNSTMSDCCSKSICNGCNYANQMREHKQRLRQSCLFCREPAPSTDEERHKQRMKRIEANNPAAFCREGTEQYIEGEYNKAFDYYKKASELGDLEAHFKLAGLYQLGHGVEKDMGKSMYHLEEAAIGGHSHARHGIGLNEMGKGNAKRAVKHFIIAAAQGNDDSIKMLTRAFKDGDLSKEDLTSALRAHKAAVDATKSPQREAAEEWYRNKFGK